MKGQPSYSSGGGSSGYPSWMGMSQYYQPPGYSGGAAPPPATSVPMIGSAPPPTDPGGNLTGGPITPPVAGFAPSPPAAIPGAGTNPYGAPDASGAMTGGGVTTNAPTAMLPPAGGHFGAMPVGMPAGLLSGIQGLVQQYPQLSGLLNRGMWGGGGYYGGQGL